jgi:hypothetical protein
MTPKEKAEELFTKFSSNTVHYDAAKQCAIIAVDEMIKLLVDLSDGNFTYVNDVIYWMEVKQEIKKL